MTKKELKPCWCGPEWHYHHAGCKQNANAEENRPSPAPSAGLSEEEIRAAIVGLIQDGQTRQAIERGHDVLRRLLSSKPDPEAEKHPWVCLVHGYKALPVCGLCVSKPDPEREAMERVVEAARILNSCYRDDGMQISLTSDLTSAWNRLSLALSALDRARSKP